jgi:signal transduction histidine kinase
MRKRSPEHSPSAATLKLARFGERAQVVVMVGEGAGRAYTLGAEPVLIGREETATIQFSSSDVSREHARIARQGNDFTIVDLGSSNGTRVNGVPLVEPRGLRYGDRIQLGSSAILIFTRYSELEDQLIQLQKLDSLGVLASGLAHDFGNVMTIVASNVEYVLERLRQRHSSEPELIDCLTETNTAAARGLELVQRLMGFARRKPGEASLFDVRELVGEVSKLVRRSLPATIDLEVDTRDEINIVGERASIEQVLLNMCINAKDAMPDGGTLRLAAFRIEVIDDGELTDLIVSPGHYAVIEVVDSGAGMDERTVHRIFEPFFTTKGARGTGLGLAMAYGVVRNHGGNILVTSKLGAGTRFEVYLPAQRPLDHSEAITSGR